MLILKINKNKKYYFNIFLIKNIKNHITKQTLSY